MKFFGFSEEEKKQIEEYLKNVKESDLEPVWVVSPDAVGEFVKKFAGEKKAIVWVPREMNSIAFDEWEEAFYAQLREDRSKDLELLKRVYQCPYVLDVSEMSENIPYSWFKSLRRSALEIPLEDIPMNDKEHIKNCEACRQELYTCLQDTAKGWWKNCPDEYKIAAWIEGIDEKDIEEHIKICGMCQEQAKRVAFLFEGAGIISSERVDKLLPIF